MTWDAYHRRKTALREILVEADRHREASADELLDTVPGAREVFADDTSFLLDVQMAWFQRLSGQLDRLIPEGGADPETVTVTAWVAAAAEMPGARTLLDANLDRPGLATAVAKERDFLARSAGVPAHHRDHDGQGRRILDVARDQAIHSPVCDTVQDGSDHERGGLMARLRSVLAA